MKSAPIQGSKQTALSYERQFFIFARSRAVQDLQADNVGHFWYNHLFHDIPSSVLHSVSLQPSVVLYLPLQDLKIFTDSKMPHRAEAIYHWVMWANQTDTDNKFIIWQENIKCV